MFKKRALVALVCVAALLATMALAGEEKAEIVTAGEAVGESPEVSLATVMKDPDKYVGKTVIITGVAAEVCQKKGCWMQVLPDGAESGIRMTFKDYGFFVPKDAAGMLIRAEGVFEIKVLSKEDADHLVGEGAKIKLNEDGTANEFGFIASGVELRAADEKKKETKEEEEEEKKG